MRSVDLSSTDNPEQQGQQSLERPVRPFRAGIGRRFGVPIVRLARLAEQQIDAVTLPAAQAAAERQQQALTPPKAIDLSILNAQHPEK